MQKWLWTGFVIISCVQIRIAAEKFTCEGHAAGYYADIDTGCQVYHMCDGLGRQFSYSCPNTTLFQQRMLICDHWYMVNCSKSELDYKANLLIGQRDKPFVEDSREHPYHRTPRPDLLNQPYAPRYQDEEYRHGRAQALSASIQNLIGVATDEEDEFGNPTGKNFTTDRPQYFLPSHWSTQYGKSLTTPLPIRKLPFGKYPVGGDGKIPPPNQPFDAKRYKVTKGTTVKQIDKKNDSVQEASVSPSTLALPPFAPSSPDDIFNNNFEEITKSTTGTNTNEAKLFIDNIPIPSREVLRPPLLPRLQDFSRAPTDSINNTKSNLDISKQNTRSSVDNSEVPAISRDTSRIPTFTKENSRSHGDVLRAPITPVDNTRSSGEVSRGPTTPIDITRSPGNFSNSQVVTNDNSRQSGGVSITPTVSVDNTKSSGDVSRPPIFIRDNSRPLGDVSRPSTASINSTTSSGDVLRIPTVAVDNIRTSGNVSRTPTFTKDNSRLYGDVLRPPLASTDPKRTFGDVSRTPTVSVGNAKDSVDRTFRVPESTLEFTSPAIGSREIIKPAVDLTRPPISLRDNTKSNDDSSSSSTNSKDFSRVSNKPFNSTKARPIPSPPSMFYQPPKFESSYIDRDTTTMSPQTFYKLLPSKDLIPPSLKQFENEFTALKTTLPPTTTQKIVTKKATSSFEKVTDRTVSDRRWKELRQMFFIPEYDFPLEAGPGPSYESGLSSFHVNPAPAIPEMRFRDGKNIPEGPECPKCDPAFLVPGTCKPCIMIRR